MSQGRDDPSESSESAPAPLADPPETAMAVQIDPAPLAEPPATATAIPTDAAPLPVEAIVPDVAAGAAPEAILDYASPRPRKRIRLPCKSRLELHADGKGVRIVETLAGRSGAIAAMVFAVVVLLEWALVCYGIYKPGRRLSDQLSDLLWAAVPWLGYLALLLAVVHQTWRKTILQVDRQRVLLQFVSPLRQVCYRWPAEQVLQIQPAITFMAQNAWPVGELRLHLASGGRVHLFTDHRLSDVERLADSTRAALAGASGEGA